MNTILNVQHAGPLVSVQDTGRQGHLRFGVSPSGAMDLASYSLANAALGNVASTPAIEVSLGGLTLKCIEGAVSVSIVGGCFSLQLNREDIPSWAMLNLDEGDTLSIRPGDWGSWCYLCFAGSLNTHEWLGSQSVHIRSGVCGNAIGTNDTLELNNCKSHVSDVVSLGDPNISKPSKVTRAVAGPQERFFDDETLANLFSKRFTISNNYDRMGMRFNGCSLASNATLDMPSEPISRGSLQVPGHGDPICLMADHHTTGGYPKIATVVSADLNSLAQCRSGDEIQFQQVNTDEAIQAARDYKTQLDETRANIMLNAEGITSRLWSSNLISGAVGIESGE